MAGFYVFVSNTTDFRDGYLCYHDKGPVLPNTYQDLPCDVSGQYVTYYNNRSDSPPTGYSLQAILELCEVEVYGCQRTMFGPKCQQTCHCVAEGCKSDSGVCDVQGCMKGWKGYSCSTECTYRVFGYDCRNTCYCQEGDCERKDGMCVTPGCQNGWKGISCNETCEAGRFGADCLHQCHCKVEGCEVADGTCKVPGCKEGFKGVSCDQECENGTFGENCNMSCGNCLNNATCNRFNGICKNGCNPGWRNTLCDLPCKKGSFGQDCGNKCHCMVEGCDAKTGTCDVPGCQAGYEGISCSQECTNSTYGNDCKMACGHCFAKKPCNRTNGTCEDGCDTGWIPPECVIRAQSKKNPPEDSTPAPLIGGVVAAVLVIAIIIVVAFIVFRNKRRQNGAAAKYETTASAVSNKGFSSLEEGLGRTDNSKPSKSNVLSHVQQEGVDDDTDTVYENNSSVIEECLHTSIDVNKIREVVATKINLKAFKDEFEKLPKGHTQPHDIGKLEINKMKNRYRTTFPYDATRVVLRSSGASSEQSDYINANYICDCQLQKKFIATQGPKDCTTEDFWRMVWQEESEIIVMLTNLKEGTKVKCALYWASAANTELSKGNFAVRVNKETKYAFFTVRELHLRNTSKKVNQTRTIYHFHFTKWPDHGTPDDFELFQFRQRVSLHRCSFTGPIVVHCSAGVGRTGTYIALDSLITEGLLNGKVDVFKFTQEMRKSRPSMIQTEDQYICLHKSLAESLQILQMQDCYQISSSDVQTTEYQTLVAIDCVSTEAEFRNATLEENINKNRDSDLLPLDNYLPYLSSQSYGRTNYINATIIPSYTIKDGYIMTQYPLPDTVVDFWRLVEDRSIDYIVWLGNPLNVDNPGIAWPDKDREVRNIAKFKVTTIKTTVVSDAINRLNIELDIKGTPKHIVTVLQAHSWVSTLPPSKECFTNLAEEILYRHSKSDEIPVLVVCPTGVTMCSTFCIGCNVIERLTLDGDRDIPAMIRQVQIRRPHSLQSQEQYNFYYELEKPSGDTADNVYTNISSVNTDNIYANA